MIYRGTSPTFPWNISCSKGWVDKLPVASGEEDVLIAHPGLEVIAPALFLNRVPVVAEAARAVRDTLDHTHRSHHLSQGSFPAPVHKCASYERSVDKLRLPLASGAKQLVFKAVRPASFLLRFLILRPGHGF